MTAAPTDQVLFLEQVQTVHLALLKFLDFEELRKVEDHPEKVALFLEGQIRNLLKQHKELGSAEDETLVQAVLDEVIGFGPLEPLLRDKNITDIFVNNSTTIFAEQKGKVVQTPVRFLNDEHVFRLVQRIASKSGKHLDLGMPYLDSHLADGSRLHVIIPPCAMDGVKISIRKFLFRKLPIDMLVTYGSVTEKMQHLLQIAVKSRFNIVICGGTGSGKTTLLNSLLDSIREGERVITMEDTPELEPTHKHVVRLISRPPNPEGKGGVSLDDLMVNALRMRPDRVILGELRGKEAFNLLHAMNTGQDGSMATLHASGTEEVISRLLNMILMARYSLSSESVRYQIAGAIDLIVHVARLVDGSRRVMRISQVSRDEKGDLKIDDLFSYEIEKITETELVGAFQQHFPTPSRRIKDKLRTSGLYSSYLEIFKND